jgi:hypothetical protein
MTIESVIARTFQILLALGGAYLVALWFVLIVWAYRDIETRSRNVVTQVFSTLLVVLFWVPGALLYLVLRPKETLDAAYQRSLEEEYLLQDLEELPRCPGCERFVEDDFVLCPHCQRQLREPCRDCNRLVDLRWPVCPYCAAARRGERVTQPDKVEAPAARWRAPIARIRRRDEATEEAEAVAARPADDADAAEHPPPSEAPGQPRPSNGVAAAAHADYVATEPIPLVPAPRGRFRRVAGERPAPADRADNEVVPADGLLTSILGARTDDPARIGVANGRARRPARPAPQLPTTAGHNGNGQSSPAAEPATTPADSAAESAPRPAESGN